MTGKNDKAHAHQQQQRKQGQLKQIPEVLRQWLDSLEPIQADQVWVYLDDNPQARTEIMAVLSKKGTQSIAAHKAWATIRANDTPEQISDRARAAAHKAWATIRARENSRIDSNR